MSEKILKALMRLFAIIAGNDNNSDGRAIVESYLKTLLNTELVNEYLEIYDDYLKNLNEGTKENEKRQRRIAVSSVKVIVICEQINEELTQKQKFIVLLNLIQFVNSDGTIKELEMEFISTVASSFNISEIEFSQSLQLATQKNITETADSEAVLIINNDKNRTAQLSKAKHLYTETLTDNLLVLKINSIGIYLVRYFGKTELFLNGQIMNPDKIYILSNGSSIRSTKVNPIYYSDVLTSFLKDISKNKITI